MESEAQSVQKSPLFQEESLLGAHFEVDGFVELASSYPNKLGISALSDTKAYLADLSSLNVMTISGEDAQIYLQTLSTANIEGLKGGESSLALFLNAQSEIIDSALILKNDEFNFMLISLQENFEEFRAWLEAYAALDKEGIKAFPNLELSYLSSQISVLALGGGVSEHVLSDYIGTQALPAQEHFSSLLLDAIPAVVINVSQLFNHPAYLLMLQNTDVVRLFRSFMSFEHVENAGLKDIYHYLSEQHPELASIYQADYQSAHSSAYKNYLRKNKNYIGGKLIE